MFGWLEDLINGITGAISDAFAGIGQTISNTIWSTMMKWMYETVFDAIADFFTMMGSMGAEIFDLSWVQATVELFTLFGWALFAAGVVVAVFDLAIEYQNGRANIKTTALNILKGFFACSLIGVVPISLYKFCISLQHEFAGNLASLFAGGKATSIAQQSLYILQHNFAQEMVTGSLFNLLALIAFAYCVIKVFFQNIKRGGILLVQMSVGSLYMFSVPSDLSYGIHADNALIFGIDDVQRKYAARTRRHARGERSAAHRATVRIGQLGKVQSHERGTRHDDGDQPFENGREGRQMRRKL